MSLLVGPSLPKVGTWIASCAFQPGVGPGDDYGGATTERFGAGNTAFSRLYRTLENQEHLWMTNTEKQIHQEISDWLGDIVALEGHVEEAMDHQLKLEGSPELTGAIKHFHDTVRDSKERAVAFQKEYGSTSGNPVIKVGSELLGKAAGFIDQLRADSISKALRDDYTAYNHVAIAYTMLHTTAMVFKDHATMQFAEQGLKTYAGMVQKLNNVIPAAVVYDIKTGEHAPAIDPSVVEECRATIDRIWTSTKN
jgi:ferritin-like metal-binding protein YciE